MESSELEFIVRYATRLTSKNGDLSELTKDERNHLRLLVQKYELETKLDVIAEELGQVKLPL